MSFHKKTIRDIDVEGKTVLVRADYNVPLDENGHITDTYRIKKSLPTLQYLLQRGARVIVCSHLGRPEGKRNTRYTMLPVAEVLQTMLPDTRVHYVNDCVGPVVVDAARDLPAGQLMLLENLRFYEAEEANSEPFAKELASLAEIFVQDGFGVVHRAHASTDAVARELPAVAGLLLENEVDTITAAMENPERPLMAIVGGAKISDKIEILNRLIDIADVVAVGGAMANTFLLASGVNIGKSVAEPDSVPLAKEILEKAAAKAKDGRFIFYVPQDGVVATSLDKTAKTRIVDWTAHVVASIENYPEVPPRASSELAEDEMILDVGPFSAAFIAGTMQLASTVIWNGAMGVTETRGLRGPVGPFSHGTELVVEAMVGQFGNKPYSVLGGGDTVGYVEDRKLTASFSHVSTGGGASMELMSGKKLPGVEALLDAEHAEHHENNEHQEHQQHQPEYENQHQPDGEMIQ